MLFIHGAGGFHEDQVMARNLQLHLGDSFQVLMPEMPDADNPGAAAWRDEIIRQLNALKNPVLVGHSLGGSVLLKLLSEETPPVSIRSLHLLAAPFWSAPDWNVKEYELASGFAENLPPELSIFLYHNEDDEIVPVSHLKRHDDQLPYAITRKFKRGGHQFRYHLSAVARDIKNSL